MREITNAELIAQIKKIVEAEDYRYDFTRAIINDDDYIIVTTKDKEGERKFYVLHDSSNGIKIIDEVWTLDDAKQTIVDIKEGAEAAYEEWINS